MNAVTQRAAFCTAYAHGRSATCALKHICAFSLFFVNRLYRVTVTHTLVSRHDGFQTVASFASEFRRWLHNRRFVPR